MLATTRMLARKLDDLSTQARAQLAKLPLWTGKASRRRSPASADASNDGARGSCGPGRTTRSSNARSTSSTNSVSDANCAASGSSRPLVEECNGAGPGAAASANSTERPSTKSTGTQSPGSRRRCTPAGRDTTCAGRRPTRASRASRSARARGLRCTVHGARTAGAAGGAARRSRARSVRSNGFGSWSRSSSGRLEGVDLLASGEGTLGSVQPAARPTRGIAHVSAPRHRAGMRLSRRAPRSRRGRPACPDAWAAFDSCSPQRLGAPVLGSVVPGSNLEGRQYG